MSQITAESISFDTIRALRNEAASAQDFDQVAVCDLALDGEIDADDYTTLSREMDRKIRSMTRDEAYQLCADAVNAARG